MAPPADRTGVLDEHRLRELIEVGSGLVGEPDQEVVLQRALSAAADLTGAGYVAFEIINSDRPAPRRFVTRENDSGAGGRVDDLVGGPDVLVVAILIGGRLWGNLYLTDRPGGEFDAVGKESARILADWTAIAVDNARRAVATAQAAAMDSVRNSIEAAELERGRWARELHDEALQSMAGVRVVLSAAGRGEDLEQVRGLLSQAVDQVDGTITEMRRLIADLRPAALDELGLTEALEALVERLGWAGTLEVDLRVGLAVDSGGRSARFAGQVENTVYRLVQEGLNNVADHAETRRASVEVIEADGEIRIRIEDHGRGFDAGDHTGGFGVLGMRERTLLAGGTFDLVSAAGEGTTITAALPADCLGRD